jgi:formyltetrahydrofolate deformylase
VGQAGSSSGGDATITLLISCPDRPGIVAAVSGFLFQHRGNIVASAQHSTNLHGGTFFMRVSFAEDSFALSPDELTARFGELALAFGMSWSVHYSRRRKRCAILVSKQDHCLVDLLWRWQRGELAMDVACVISNHQDLEPVARMYGLPFRHVPVRRESRAEDHRRVLDLVVGQADFLVLARYMQVLDPFFVEAFPNRIVNIHHSFLPAFGGANPYERAFQRGVKLIGATSHFVTNELDEGPIIAQDVIRCDHTDSVADLVRKGRDVERRVLAEAVRLYVEDRVLVHENKTITF